MNDSPTLKDKVTRLIICSVILFSFKYIFHYIFPIIPISELGPASALPPIFGLMFGPWGAGGAALGYLISEVVAGYPPEIYIISFFVQFLYGYIPYKLWYTLGIHKTNSLPRLNTVNNLIKFVSIMFITSFVVAGLLGVLMDGLGIYDLVSYTTLVFAFNNFDFAIMLGTLIIIGANIYGIKMIKPDTKVKSRIDPRIYKWIGITALISGAFNVYYSTQNGPDILGWAAGIICYTLVLAYILKPVTKEVKIKKTSIKVSLTERLIVIFIIIGAIIAMINGIRTILTISYMSEMEFWQTVYLNITLTLSFFYLSSIGFLWYIERNITTPIESISDIVKNYVSDHKGLGNSANVISTCEQYATENTEIGILAGAFQKMIRDVKIYTNNLQRVTAEKQKINTELNVARRIQIDMLPRNFPENPDAEGYDVYATTKPAKEVGGDFYDFFKIDDDRLAVVIADVSGKGVPAALFMVIAKTLIKNYTQLGKSPEEVFTTVNNQLCDGNDENMFVTAWMGVLEIETGKFTYVNAGHTTPLLKHADQDYKWFKSEPGFVLAGMENIEYHQKECHLHPGDRIYLYTDGVTESINSDNELFGTSRLITVMNRIKDPSLREQLSYVKEKIDLFAKGRKQFDDITMIIMEYKN
jgi:sigma-B regulation protein RsbU (phosphoserine phosphatase)